MMKTAALIILFCLEATEAAYGSGQTHESKKIYLLRDTNANRWCAYRQKGIWKAAANTSGAMSVGTLTYANGRAVRVEITETDESGDWTVYDQYVLDGHGEIVRLSRLINLLSGDESILQTFSVVNRTAEKIGTTLKDLSAGKPLLARRSDWTPALPVIAEFKKFPFYELIKRPDKIRGLRHCTAP